MKRIETKRLTSRGFTLAEVLIALGVLAVGLTMSAALFPAAIIETEKSVNASIGTLICDNAVLAAKRIDPGTNDLLANNPFQRFHPPSGSDYVPYMVPILTISQADECYPVPSLPRPAVGGVYSAEWIEIPGSAPAAYNPRSPTGYRTLARSTDQTTAARLEVMVVSYRKLAPENRVEFYFYDVATSVDETEGEWFFMISPAAQWNPSDMDTLDSQALPLDQGSWLLLGGLSTPDPTAARLPCQAVRVKDFDGSRVIVDQEIPVNDGSPAYTYRVYRLVELAPDGNGDWTPLDREPVMSVLKTEVTR